MEARSAASFRVLVVDDNPEIHTDFKKILTGVGPSPVEHFDAKMFGLAVASSARVQFLVDSAYQGQEAAAKVASALQDQSPYALAFVDLRMPPGWDGIETIRRIWAVDRDVQIVICTAYADYSWEEIAQGVGTTDQLLILKKPFDNIEVLQIAHALGRKWALTQEARHAIDQLHGLVHARTVELEQANTRLAESERQFSRAFMANPVPMAIVSDPALTMVNANDALARLLGTTVRELIGKSLHEPSRLASTTAADHLRRCLQENISVQHHASEIRSTDGKVYEILLSANRIEINQRHQLLVSIQDITERSQLERQLRHAQRLEAVGLLAAGIAHDFNNLLTVIQGYSSLDLRGDTADPERRTAMAAIRDAASRAALLTRQLLAFSRKQVLHLKALDANVVITQLEKMLHRLLAGRIRLVLDLTRDLPLMEADLGSIEQVIVNLIVNARDAMPHGGHITLRTGTVHLDGPHSSRTMGGKTGTFVCLEVEDTGTGIAEDVLPHIFDPFFTTKEVGKGSGLGLATVHGMIEQHRGWIETISQVGVGTRFRIFLPTTSAAQGASAVTATELQPRSGCRETILLVEDEPGVRQLATTVLTRHGYQVIEAEDGNEALRVWETKKHQIDLLLTDMVMPGGLTGRMLAAQLTTARPSLRVIYTSGYSVDAVEGNCFLEEGINFIPKPYTIPNLIKIVQAALNLNQGVRPIETHSPSTNLAEARSAAP